MSGQERVDRRIKMEARSGRGSERSVNSHLSSRSNTSSASLNRRVEEKMSREENERRKNASNRSSNRARRAQEQAPAPMPPMSPPRDYEELNGAVIAHTIDEDPQTDKLQQLLEIQQQQIKQQEERMTDAERLRQEESRLRQEREERKERIRKQKTKKRLILAFGVTIIIAVAAVLVVMFALPKNASPDASPTPPPEDGRFDPPSRQACNAIATANQAFFTEYTEGKDIGISIEIDVNPNGGNDMEQILEAYFQQDLLPYLAGCPQSRYLPPIFY